MKKIYILVFRSHNVGYFSTLRKLDSYLYKEIRKQHLDVSDFSVKEIILDSIPNKVQHFYLEEYE